MGLSVDEIERLAELVTRERLDSLEYDGLRIVKSSHAAPVAPSRAGSVAVSSESPDSDEDDEDLLFHSSDD